MSFNSYGFILGFLPIVLATYWWLVQRYSAHAILLWLLLASIGFYAMASPITLLIIAPSITLDYFIAQHLLRPDRPRSARVLLLTLGVLANITLLASFKYIGFITRALNATFGVAFHFSGNVLPLGLSFLTFQKIAFLVDVYSGQIQSIKPLEFLLFTLLFPRTVAGPIVHYYEVVPQFAFRSRNLSADLAVGLCLFTIGMFKKAVIADSLGDFVAPVFDWIPGFDAAPVNPILSLTTSWLAALSYTLQIYFDFSGYSDMALGVARMFGVRLPMNFNSPLKAANIVDFWNRWHITLTRFLTTYVYTPLVLHLSRARNRKIPKKSLRKSLTSVLIMIAMPTLATMAVSGIWHGAGWTFVIWGLLHGVYLTVNQTWRALRPRGWANSANYEKVMRPCGFLLTFSAVVIAFVFFRSTSVQSAFAILGAMAGSNGLETSHFPLLQELGVPSPELKVMENVYGFGLLVPYVEVLLLLMFVLCLPNSLEIMRQFAPALNFEGGQLPSAKDKATGGRGLGELTLSPAIAAVAAVLFVMGLMALDRTSAFAYAQF